MSKLHSGIILQVIKDGFTAEPMMGGSEERERLIKKGEIIEITIAYEWHFRTIFGDHFVAPEEKILKYCKVFAATPPSLHPQKISLETMLRHQMYLPYGDAKHSGYAEMPDYEAYKRIRIAAFDSQNAKDRKYLVRQSEA